MGNPFEAGSFQYKAFESMKNMNLDELKRKDIQNEQGLTYTLDAECRRMALSSVIFHAIKQAEKKVFPAMVGSY